MASAMMGNDLPESFASAAVVHSVGRYGMQQGVGAPIGKGDSFAQPIKRWGAFVFALIANFHITSARNVLAHRDSKSHKFQARTWCFACLYSPLRKAP